MSLSGNLKTMDLAELLQWLSIGRKTGALTIIKDKTKNYIYFREGRIISSNSNDPTKYLGQFILFQGKVNESQLKRALEIQQKSRQNLGKVLVQEGFISEAELQKTLRTRTEEVIYDLFLWEDGFFHFTDGVNVEDLILINVDVNSIIFEGVRRKDEWARIRKVFPSNNILLALCRDTDLKQATLTPLQKKLLFLVNVGKTISEIILELHGSDFLVSYELFQLLEKNLIEVKEVREAPVVEPEDPQKLFDHGMELMRQRKFQEAIAVFQEIIRGDPQNFRAHEQIELAEKAICQHLYRDSLPANKIPYFLVPENSLSRYSLSHEEGFVASRVNGTWDIKSIVLLSPLRELEILQILDKLIKLKVIALK